MRRYSYLGTVVGGLALCSAPLLAVTEADISRKNSLCADAEQLSRQGADEFRQADRSLAEATRLQKTAGEKSTLLQGKTAQFGKADKDLESLVLVRNEVTKKRGELEKKVQEINEGKGDSTGNMASRVAPGSLWLCKAETLLESGSSQGFDTSVIPNQGCHFQGEQYPSFDQFDGDFAAKGLPSKVQIQARIGNINAKSQELSALRTEMQGLRDSYLQDLNGAERNSKFYSEQVQRAKEYKDQADRKSEEADRLMGTPHACQQEFKAEEDDDGKRLLAEAKVLRESIRRKLEAKRRLARQG